MPEPFDFNTTADEVVGAFQERVRGRNFLITGPSPGGIGEATTLSIARGHPATLILVGRTPTKLDPVVAAIRPIHSDIDVRVYEVDLSSLDSVRNGAMNITRDAKADGGFGHIDILINNAGVSGGAFTKTADGVEHHFATNYLGPWLFTNLLMQLLKRSDEPRIVSLTSGAHRIGLGVGDYSDINFEKREYTWFKAYGESKMAVINFARYLSTCQSLTSRNLTTFSVQPGLIYNTNLSRSLDDEEKRKVEEYIQSTGVQRKTHEQGASTTLVAALDPSLASSNGAFLMDCAVADPFCEDAKRVELDEPLWRLSETLVGETFAY